MCFHSAGHCAAGIGGEIAANLAIAFGSQAQREQTVDLFSLGLDRDEKASCVDGNRIVDPVDCPHSVHAGEIDHDLDALSGWHRAADQRCVSALRHDLEPIFPADRDDGGDLFRPRRFQQQGRTAANDAGPVDDMRFKEIGLGAPARWSDRLLQTVKRLLELFGSDLLLGQVRFRLIRRHRRKSFHFRWTKMKGPAFCGECHLPHPGVKLKEPRV